MRSFGADFDVPAGYLNTPSIGIPSASIADAVDAWLRQWRSGAASPPDFDPSVSVSREAFGRLIGVPGEDVAIGASASQLVASVAGGVADGARVLTAQGEFTSVTFPFAAHAHRGVTVTEVPLAELPAQVEHYDLVAVSVVQSADGAAVDLGQLRAAAEAAGVRVLLDATQAAGWQPLELGWADWVVAAGYKWLLSPRGAAWLAVRPDALEATLPTNANWYAGEDPWQTVYGLPLRLAAGARRFDVSPVWHAHAGAAVALPYLASLDLGAVRAHCVELAGKVLAGLGLPPADSAILAIEGDETVFQRLTAAGVRASRRAGKIRLGFHLYNSPADAELVLDAFE
jgi:selenocysteine lyase/cysteine desulfurase